MECPKAAVEVQWESIEKTEGDAKHQVWNIRGSGQASKFGKFGTANTSPFFPQKGL